MRSTVQGRGPATALVLDAGALVALERGDAFFRAVLARATEHHMSLIIPAGVLAQTWRGSPQQARLGRLLKDPSVELAVLDGPTARAVGILCGKSGHPDVVDVHVALAAKERGAAIVTSDPGDIASIDPRLRLIDV